MNHEFHFFGRVRYIVHERTFKAHGLIIQATHCPAAFQALPLLEILILRKHCGYYFILLWGGGNATHSFFFPSLVSQCHYCCIEYIGSNLLAEGYLKLMHLDVSG